MEKKINKILQNIIVEKNVLSKLNEIIEKQIKNSNVIMFVDFLAFQTNQKIFEEIKSCSLNNINLFVVSPNDKFNKFESFLNETFGFVVCVGENWLLKFGQSFAIKNNINYGFVNLFMPKTDIFAQKMPNFDYFPPSFCLIEKNNLNEEEKFFMLCDVFKHSFILLENCFNTQNENLKIFSIKFLDITQNLTNLDNLENLNENFDEKLYNAVISIAIMLEKSKFSYNLHKNSNEFQNFANNFVLGLIYKNLFLKINSNNLFLSRVKFLDETLLKNYSNFDFKFYRFYLLNFKEKFLINAQKFLDLNKKLLYFLKQNFFKEYFKFSKFLNLSIPELEFNQTFLQKMSYFEIFLNAIDLNCINF